MSKETALGAGAEFDAIRLLLQRWGDCAEGIGDDAAVWRPPRGEQIVMSVDTVVEGRHFRRGWLAPGEIGYRAVTAALSDLAAMAARPAGVLIAFVISDEWREALPALADGIGDAVRSARTLIRGGNISGGSELSITTTVFGHAFAPLMRSGARVGDRVYLTGRLGGPGAALAALNAGRSDERFRGRFTRPTSRIDEARWLASSGASSAIDISDGLIADARHLAAASNVRLDLDAARVPLVEGAERRAALESGEEYELIVTGESFDTRAFEARFGIPLTEIGRVGEGPSDVHVTGARVENIGGHDHLSR